MVPLASIRLLGDLTSYRNASARPVGGVTTMPPAACCRFALTDRMLTATPELSVKVNENEVAHWKPGSVEAVTGAAAGLATIVTTGAVVGLGEAVGYVFALEPPQAPRDSVASVAAITIVRRNIGSLPRSTPGTPRPAAGTGPASSYCLKGVERFPKAARRRGRTQAGSIRPFELNARVVMAQDGVERGAGLGHAERPDLAQADAVAPALAGEDEALHRPRGVAFAVHDEEVLAQPQAPPHLKALQHQLTARAGHCHLDHAAGHAEAAREEVGGDAHIAVAGQGRLQLAGALAHLPPVDARGLVRGRPQAALLAFQERDPPALDDVAHLVTGDDAQLRRRDPRPVQVAEEPRGRLDRVRLCGAADVHGEGAGARLAELGDDEPRSARPLG